MAYAAVNGLNMYCEVHGDGAPYVRFLKRHPSARDRMQAVPVTARGLSLLLLFDPSIAYHAA